MEFLLLTVGLVGFIVIFIMLSDICILIINSYFLGLLLWHCWWLWGSLCWKNATLAFSKGVFFRSLGRHLL